jgi:hypothetical protein
MQEVVVWRGAVLHERSGVRRTAWCCIAGASVNLASRRCEMSHRPREEWMSLALVDRLAVEAPLQRARRWRLSASCVEDLEETKVERTRDQHAVGREHVKSRWET